MKAVLAILFVVLLLLQVRLWIGPGSMGDIARLEDEIEKQNGTNAGLEARNSVLMEEVGDLRNGLDSIEERARNELGLIRRGETFYLIVEDDPDSPPQPETQLVDESRIPPALVPEDVAPEPPPEIAEDENPYLDIFRDEEDAPAEAQSTELQAPEAGQTAGQ